MSDAPDDRPRTWVPLVGAGAVGAVVVAAAVAAFALGGGPGETEAAVIAACEAEYSDSGGAAVVTGEIYDPTQWRDHYAAVAANSEVDVPLADLPEEAVAQWEARAEAFREDGEGTWVIVWLLRDESHAQCTVPVAAGAVDAALASVGPVSVEPSGAAG